jgi:hypothetical protein
MSLVSRRGKDGSQLITHNTAPSMYFLCVCVCVCMCVCVVSILGVQDSTIHEKAINRMGGEVTANYNHVSRGRGFYTQLSIPE